MSTPEMNTLRPLRSQSAPSRRAVVVMRCELEGHGAGAVGQAREPLLFLGLRAEAGDHRAADRRRHDHHQEGAARGAEFFQDDGEFGYAAAPATVCLRQVDAEVAELGGLGPEGVDVVVAAVTFA
jgi:hypothetical protein